MKSNINVGGIHFETNTAAYRGGVTFNGIRYRTKRYSTKRAAQRALNRLKKQLVELVK